MIDNGDDRRLEVPIELISDAGATELVSVWFSQNKVKIMTRSGTGLDDNSAIWGEILAGLALNIAQCTREATGADETTTLEVIKNALDKSWPSNPTIRQ
jgi:hypothetical protein